MASMNKSQRAAYYLQRIRTAKNPKEEVQKILAEIDTLVWTSTNTPLTKQEKQEIIEELELLIISTITKSKPITEASDNSGILDVIHLLKRGVTD
jgi:hypothetical protein